MTTKNQPKWPPARVYVVLSHAPRVAFDVSIDEDEICSLFEDSEVEGRKPELYECQIGQRLKVTKKGYASYDVKPFPRKRTAAERAVELGEIGGFGFGVDPKDSAALLELRAAIDDHLGWRNEKEEHAGDYVARVKQVGSLVQAWRDNMRRTRAEKAAAKKPKVDGIVLDPGERVFVSGQENPRDNGLRFVGKPMVPGKVRLLKRKPAKKRKATQ